MEIPIAIFLSFIAVSLVLTLIGLWKKIPVLMFLCGFLFFFWSVTTDTIILDTLATSGGQDLVHYEVTSPAVSVTANAITPIRAEFPTTSSSQLIEDTFDCMKVPLAKSGAPVAGTMVRAGVWGTTGNLIKQFGSSLDVQNMAVGLTTYQFCLPEGETYKIGTFPNVERIGIEYNAGDAVNFITGRTDNSNPYDGTITVAQVFTTSTGLWSTPSTTNDLNMKLWLRGNVEGMQQIDFEFSAYPKLLFILIGSLIMIIGAIVWRMPDEKKN